MPISSELKEQVQALLSHICKNRDFEAKEKQRILRDRSIQEDEFERCLLAVERHELKTDKISAELQCLLFQVVEDRLHTFSVAFVDEYCQDRLAYIDYNSVRIDPVAPRHTFFSTANRP